MRINWNMKRENLENLKGKNVASLFYLFLDHIAVQIQYIFLVQIFLTNFRFKFFFSSRFINTGGWVEAPCIVWKKGRIKNQVLTK